MTQAYSVRRNGDSTGQSSHAHLLKLCCAMFHPAELLIPPLSDFDDTKNGLSLGWDGYELNHSGNTAFHY